MAEQPLNILVLASYFKGERFMRQAAKRGHNVYLLTVEKLLSRPWPREILKDIFAQANESNLQHTIHTVSYLARSLRIDRLVPMDDFDVETAAALREHLRLPGMGDTTARHFRDKLAMRVKAQEEGIPVPEFVHVLNHDAIRDFIKKIPAPWMLKPRSEASATGISKIENEPQLWAEIEKKGDRASYFLLERFLPGDVFHADSIIAEKKVVFAATHRCGTPPFNVAHGGGIFTTVTVPRGSADEKALRTLNEQVLAKLNLLRGVSHVEFIKARSDGKFYMLEAAARVGGAHIADVVEASSGINLWEEWANIEIDRGEKPYKLPAVREEYGGVVMTLASSEHPDLSGFNDPEVVMRSPEAWHAGLIIRAKDHKRAQTLIDGYQERLLKGIHTSAPALDKPLH